VQAVSDDDLDGVDLRHRWMHGATHTQKLQQITFLPKLETPFQTTFMLPGYGSTMRPLKEERKHHGNLQSNGFHRGGFTIGFKRTDSSCTNMVPTLHIGTKNRLGLQ